MYRVFCLVLVAEASLFAPASADDPEAEAATSVVRSAVAETSASEELNGGLELVVGSNGGTADWRPGLLGHRYVESRYHHFMIGNDGFTELFDRSQQGFDLTFNLPIVGERRDGGHVGVDAFLSHRYLRLSGGRYTRRRSNALTSVEDHSNLTQVGASCFVEHPRLGAYRPFVQLGLQNVILNRRVTYRGSERTYKDDGRVLLISPGVEVDLADRAAIRATFELIPVLEGDSSRFLGDVVVWPVGSLLLRGGVVVPFDGEGYGGTVGVGTEF